MSFFIFCSKCGKQLPEKSKYCPYCGVATTNREISSTGDSEPSIIIPQQSKLALISMILGIVGYSMMCCYFGVLLVPAAFVTGLIAFITIWRSKGRLSGEGFAVAGISLGGIPFLLLPFFVGIAIPIFISFAIPPDVSTAKEHEQKIATALQSYFTDNNSYPLPDYTKEGRPIVPHILTTPVAYLPDLSSLEDPFRKDPDTEYGYGADTGRGWIIQSYGPDKEDGNSGETTGHKLDVSIAWSDNLLGFKLEPSGLTYDPTNGTISPGDIYRRGP